MEILDDLQSWYNREVILGFPFGELSGAFSNTAALFGLKNPAIILLINGKEGFRAEARKGTNAKCSCGKA